VSCNNNLFCIVHIILFLCFEPIDHYYTIYDTLISELEEEFVINWSVGLTDRLGSRLYALWNRTVGDCLLDSILQSTWGIFDTDNSLRQAMSDSLKDGAMT